MARDPFQQQDDENDGWNNYGQSGPKASPQASTWVNMPQPQGPGAPTVTPGSQPPSPAPRNPGPVQQQGNAGGSGYVNISTLLNLNRGGGQAVQNDLLHGKDQQYANAQKELGDAYNGFKQSLPGAVDFSSYYAPGSNYQQLAYGNDQQNQQEAAKLKALIAKLQGEQIPGDFSKQAGYGKAAEDVQSLQDYYSSLGQPGGAAAAMMGYGDTGGQAQFDAMFAGGASQAAQASYQRIKQMLGSYDASAGQASQAAEAQRQADLARAEMLEQGFENHLAPQRPAQPFTPKAPPHSPRPFSPDEPTTLGPDVVYPGLKNLLGHKRRQP